MHTHTHYCDCFWSVPYRGVFTPVLLPSPFLFLNIVPVPSPAPPLSPSTAGVIRTALAGMDREARERYFLVVQAKDMAGSVGGLSGTTTVNVTLTDVNDNPPRFPQSAYTHLTSDPQGL